MRKPIRGVVSPCAARAHVRFTYVACQNGLRAGMAPGARRLERNARPIQRVIGLRCVLPPADCDGTLCTSGPFLQCTSTFQLAVQRAGTLMYGIILWRHCSARVYSLGLSHYQCISTQIKKRFEKCMYFELHLLQVTSS